MSEQAYEYDEQQYEVSYVIADSTLIWAGSEEEARQKAHGMGYLHVEAVRPVAGDHDGAEEVPGD